MSEHDANLLRSVASCLSARTPRRAAANPYASIAWLLAPLPALDETSRSRPGAPPLQLLLIERAHREGDPWSGHMALPGGRVDPGDASTLAAAMRETLEETGIAVREADLLGELDDVFPLDSSAAHLKQSPDRSPIVPLTESPDRSPIVPLTKSPDRSPSVPLVVRAFVFGLPGCPPLTLSAEVASALWVPLADLCARACTAHVYHRGARLSVPAYRCGPHVIWGMTHRVVNGLLSLV